MKEEIHKSKIREVLTHEVTILVSVVTITFSIFGVYKGMSDRQLRVEDDISFIKNNHLKHIEADIDEIRQDIEGFSDCQEEQGRKLERVLTIIEERNNASSSRK